MKLFPRYFFFSAIILWSCDSGEPLKHSDDKEYFPLKVGAYQIYSVDETRYVNQISTHQVYELKTEIIDSFQGQEGSNIFVIHRSKRTSVDELWEFIDTWSARVNDFEAVINEGNTSFIRIAFPATNSMEWNGNSLNNQPEDLYNLNHVGKPYELETGETFEDCLIVNQQDELETLLKDDRKEVYSRSIGLIYRKSVYYQFKANCNDDDCSLPPTLESSKEYYQVLKEYGQN